MGTVRDDIEETKNEKEETKPQSKTRKITKRKSSAKKNPE